jgi:hypothetical protein
MQSQAEPPTEAFFARVRAAFDRAAQTRGVRTRSLLLAGQAVQLHFAGEALVPRILPALEHLPETAAVPALELFLFAGDAMGDVPVDAPSDALPLGDEGWSFSDETHDAVWNPYFGSLTMLDRAKGKGYFWTRRAEEVSYHETSFPLRPLWQWWFAGFGFQLAHAAAVANGRGAAVFVGASGAGKSTIALACLEAPLCYLGDDFLLLRAEPTPQVYALYSSAKLHADHWRMFPHLQGAVQNRERLETEKALMFVHAAFPEKLCADAEARVLVLPRVVGTGKTYVQPIHKAQVLRALAVSTLFLLPGTGGAAFEALAQFARGLPSFELVLGQDLTEIPPVVQELLETYA